MSDTTRRRIRAQGSARDPDIMGFVLDAPVQSGQEARLDQDSDAPLAIALFRIDGVVRVDVAGATVRVQKSSDATWDALKPDIATAIRAVLDETDAPLGMTDLAPDTSDPDAVLLRAVTALLEKQVNPAIASHGGQITAEGVTAGAVYLRMSGGCQGCAASAATLRDGVERTLRAALPQIARIVDVTDHAAGSSPFYARDNGPAPALNRPVPPGVIGWNDGQITVDPDYLAPKLGLTPETLRNALKSGAVTGVTEVGVGADTGKSRIVLRSATRAWAAEVDATGAAREIPPPRMAQTAAIRQQDLSGRVRAHLEALPENETPMTYGALARALGLWMPGAIGKVTLALEATMREDAAAGRPFIAARVVNRGGRGLPGKGFFDLARDLCREPQDAAGEPDFHARQLQLLTGVGATNTQHV